MSSRGSGFVDEAKIYVKAGKGGKGCRSFHKTGSRIKKIANGGDGGKGGNVVIKTDPNIYTLIEFRYRRHIKAPSGKNGSSNRKTGRAGKDYLVKVPPGTLIYDAENGLLLRDLAEPYKEIIIARGGKAGKGNAKVEEPEPPGEGEIWHLLLELKSVADVGLIGYPNAGKSSLISSISKAKPKIAAYPFTTKSPILGIVEYQDKLFKIADIPGLIKGAHQGFGLGDRFLRHIERTKILIFVIDMAAVDGRHPWDDFLSVKNELESYKPELLNKPYLLVANKMDLETAKENITEFKKRIRKNLIEISCKDKTGLEKLLKRITNLL